MLRNTSETVSRMTRKYNRRSVWHAGFLHAKEAQELSQKMERKRQEIDQSPPCAASLTNELDDLKLKYFYLCGEEWEEGEYFLLNQADKEKRNGALPAKSV